MSILLKAVSWRQSPDAELGPLNLSIDSGEMLVLIGPKGSGKSVLLKLLAGHLLMDAGALYFNNQLVADPATAVSELSPSSPIELGFDGTMATLGMGDCARSQLNPLHCSTGERQWAELQKVLSDMPDILLMDEPFSGLDPASRQVALSQLKTAQAATGTTSVYVTHDLFDALSSGGRVAVMDRGVLRQLGTGEQIYREPENELVAGFVGKGSLIIAHSLGYASSLRDGYCRIITSDFEAEVRCSPASEAGDVMVLVRPEEVSLVSHAAMSSCTPALVLACRFAGSCYELLVETPASNRLMVQSPTDVHIGQSLIVQVKGGWVLNAEPV